MRPYILILSLFLVCNKVYGQAFNVGLSYKYLYANQWDKAIQSYNFSRPFISEKQPLLTHGLNTSASYIFKSPKKIKQGIDLSYSYFKSTADNENLDNSLNLHFLNLGYVLHYADQEKMNGFCTDLIVSASSSALFRHVNGEPYQYDDATSKAFGIGANFDLKLAYGIKLKTENILSTFVSMAYTPYLFSPNSEAVINQTKGLTSKNWTGLLSTQIGVAYHIKRNE